MLIHLYVPFNLYLFIVVLGPIWDNLVFILEWSKRFLFPQACGIHHKASWCEGHTTQWCADIRTGPNLQFPLCEKYCSVACRYMYQTDPNLHIQFLLCGVHHVIVGVMYMYIWIPCCVLCIMGWLMHRPHPVYKSHVLIEDYIILKSDC